MPNLGDTFMGGGEVHGTDHLWIVINDPVAHGGQALIVNISTLRLNAEPTCLLKAGEHPFVKHASYVRYASARSAKSSDLNKLIQAGRLISQPAASAALVAKIQAGAMASPMLPVGLKALL